MQTIRPRRSFIFCPGTKPAMFPKALKSGADIVCVDLEDAVAPADKAAAREETLALFERPQEEDGAGGEVERIVRVNCLRTPDGMMDVQALLERERPPPALMLPKVKGPEEVRGLADLLDEFDRACRLHVIVETNEGLEAAHEIAGASDRTEALFFGGVDMAADLRCAPTWPALAYARSRTVHAAATAGLDVIDVPYLDLNDLEGMRREAKMAAELGFVGKGAIHPKQIPILNAIFTPDAAAVERARRIVAAFEEGGTGLLVLDGKLIERPVLRAMYRILA
ncbi:MAG: CoA ester lyase, partial [Kiloniellales bacterium]|nr:CoA ester lyase [Kiloniellales bacterium]